MGLELTIERSYQTHSHNVHCQITGLVRRFSRRKNMSSSRIHSYYIILNTEFKLFCCVIISSGFKGKKKNMFCVIKMKECRKEFVLFSFLRTPDSCLLLESPRHLSPQGPRTSYQPT